MRIQLRASRRWPKFPSPAAAAGARSRSPRARFYLGAPGRLPVGELDAVADRRQAEGRRVLAVAHASGAAPDTAG